MAFFTFAELVDLIIMVLAIGFIFSRIFKRKPQVTQHYDPLAQYAKSNEFFEDLKYGVIIAAPAVVFHEFAHKFVAMSFGAQAILTAPIEWYAIAIILLLLNFPIVFFVGGIVSVSGLSNPFLLSLVAIAGPLTNLGIWAFIRYYAVKQRFAKKYLESWVLAARLNMFLFVFNLIPLPGFDGFNFVFNLFRGIGGLF
ncbi:hypothetical protein GOV05_04135 [Candidatus Woesearchaeota archaeon]|nr:hypothetical protein [Candidatus Woesearchaeota archaeon]